jgi:hypothetical protein
MMPRLVISAVVIAAICALELVARSGIIIPGTGSVDPDRQTVEQLDRALEAIDELEERVEARRSLASETDRKRRELTHRVSELDQEELEAVAAELVDQAQGSSPEAIWIGGLRNLVIGVVSFLLGMWVQQKRRSGIRL